MCPEAFAAMAEANQGHEVSYGNDTWTDKASNLIREVFETNCEVFFVFNGTAANSLSLASLCQAYHSILCHELAHVEVAECGAPEFFANGSKVLLLDGADGKIDPKAIERAVNKRTDVHYPKPSALSLTQATEVGTVYSLDELRALTDVARHFRLRVHMDGARFANAIACLGLTPKEITWQSGVDVLCFGGLGEAEGAGLGVVDVGAFVDGAFDRLRIKLSVRAVQEQDFAAVGKKLRGAALSHLHMGQLMAENAVVRLAEGGQRERIGGCAIEDEKHLAIGLEDFAAQVRGFVGPGVVAITDFVALVGFGHGGEGFGTHAGVIVAGELAAGESGGGHG